MFEIKICGITTIDDAQMAVDAGTDAIGLNFCPQSSRYLSFEAALPIAESIPNRVKKVGVFVNSPAHEIKQRHVELRLNFVQLHGDESPEYVAELEGIPLIKVFRPQADLMAIEEYLSRCESIGHMPAMILIDSFDPKQFGGTGRTANWIQLATGRPRLGSLPLILAGGLKPDNVAEAIAQVRPTAVDVASGVEATAGRKSSELTHQFVAAARHAFELIRPNR